MAGTTVVVREPGRTPLRLVIEEPLQIGRDCAGLLLHDPQISRLHLELRPDGGHVIATDLGSTNGTSIDGRPLTTPTRLTIGMVVLMGATTVELHVNPRTTVVAGPSASTIGIDLRQTSIDIVADAVREARPDLTGVHPGQGTITIVFSDIEASTQRAQQLGDQRWFDLLSVHNSIIRRQVQRHLGTEVKAQGDGFMLTFPSARTAVKCMCAVQRDLKTHSEQNPDQALRVRIGLHTGEVILDDDGDLFGIHVNLAARIANAANGAEIVVSSLVRQIIESRGDIAFGEAREAELKGLTGTHTMYPIIWDNDDS